MILMSVFCELCVVRYRSLRRADHSSTGVLRIVVCPMNVIAKPRKGGPRPGIRAKRHRKKIKSNSEIDEIQRVTKSHNAP